jgi:hypothetical protein
MTQVQFNQRIGPRGGMADASVLGADIGDIDTSRCEATTGEHNAYFPSEANTSQRRDANLRPSSRAACATSDATCDPAKAEIDAAWDRLNDDVKAAVLAMVRAAAKRGSTQ